MKPAYYNEVDPFCCGVLRRRIADGSLPPGKVDERDVREVQPEELRGYGQIHLFAGIGGFPYAARLAGLPDDFPLLTGGWPCQDSSVAISIHGRRFGLAGERSGLAHEALRLIAAVRPDHVVLENVPGLGGEARIITSGLAGARYRVRVEEREALDVGAPHTRRRLWFIAHRDGARLAESGAKRSPAARRDPWASVAGNLWRAGAGRGGGMDDGLPDRVDAVRALGNAIVPQVACEIMRGMACPPPADAIE